MGMPVGEVASTVRREGGRARGSLGSWSGWEMIWAQVGAMVAHAFPGTGKRRGAEELGVEAF